MAQKTQLDHGNVQKWRVIIRHTPLAIKSYVVDAEDGLAAYGLAVARAKADLLPENYGKSKDGENWLKDAKVYLESLPASEIPGNVWALPESAYQEVRTRGRAVAAR